VQIKHRAVTYATNWTGHKPTQTVYTKKPARLASRPQLKPKSPMLLCGDGAVDFQMPMSFN